MGETGGMAMLAPQALVGDPLATDPSPAAPLSNFDAIKRIERLNEPTECPRAIARADGQPTGYPLYTSTSMPPPASGCSSHDAACHRPLGPAVVERHRARPPQGPLS